MMIRRSEEKALETVQSALDGQIGMVQAAHSLLSALCMNSDLASEEDFNLIRAIVSETDDLPIGRVRELWHPDALREKDRELARCEVIWGEQMTSACQRIRRVLLVRKVLTNRHLSVAERRFVEPIRKQEVMDAVRSFLRESSIFPEEGREGVIYEGAAIGLTASGAQITLRRTLASNPRTVAERRVQRYEDLNAAIEAFIDLEWGRGIDGIPIESGR